ncbi:hypothetical protein Tcan_08422 [Toxocara canis]|uniref:Uncharacterized protein n=1 Tax=Toxocara canis TaxID=6265 RepID=A0A0B2VLN7_TOXCA|nr:hypothetical protein Tcan_08422 [Toxocara canis]
MRGNFGAERYQLYGLLRPARRVEEVSLVKRNTPPHRPRCISSTCPSSVPFGVVPVTGGIMEAVSPVSDVISDFSTSPASQSDLPSMMNSPQANFRLGHSLSSSDDSFTPQQHSENEEASDDPVFGMESSSSPRCGSSVPLRPSVAQISQMRNHSFPFAALLTATSSSSVCSGQQLPQLAENSNSTKRATPGRRSLQNASTLGTTTVSIHQSATVPADVNLMRTTSVASDGIVKSENNSEIQTRNDDEDVMSGDESFVKVAFANSGALDGDLGEFVRECRLAPSQLSCFRTDNPATIPGLLAEFESHQKMFDNFISRMQAQIDDEEI